MKCFRNFLTMVCVAALCVSLSACTGLTTSSQPPRLPASAVATDTAGLYRFGNNLAGEGDMVQAFVCDNVLHFRYTHGGTNDASGVMTTYSLGEDKIMGNIDLPADLWKPGPLDNGGFYTIFLDTHEVVLYDSRCRETDRKTVNCEEGDWGAAMVSRDGRYLVYERVINGHVVLHDLTTGESSEVYQSEGPVDMIGCQDGKFYLSSQNNTALCIDIVTKTCTAMRRDNRAVLLAPTGMVGTSNNYLILMPYGDVSAYRMAKQQEPDEAPLTTIAGAVTTYVQEEKAARVRVYNTEKNTVSPALPIGGTIQTLLFCGQDRLLIVALENGAFNYYLYDMTDTTGVTSANISKVDEAVLCNEPMGAWYGDEKTLALAQNILDTYHVRMLYGKDAVSLDEYQYVCDPIHDDEIYDKMQAVKEFLDFLPDGLTCEMAEEREIRLFLCRSIRHEDNSGHVAGFASQFAGLPFIAVDVDGYNVYFKESLAHEFSHLMDNGIEAKWLNGWIDLLPENIRDKAYINSYNKGCDSLYTTFDNNSSDIWFYDVYSRTFPTEDRAMLFQKMYVSAMDGKALDDLKHEHLQQKIRYLCVMLRRNFASCRTKDALPWEVPFGPINENEFSI